MKGSRRKIQPWGLLRILMLGMLISLSCRGDRAAGKAERMAITARKIASLVQVLESFDERGDRRGALPFRLELAAICRQAGEPRREARLQYELGNDYRLAGEYRKASECFRCASRSFLECGDLDGRLDCLRMQGVIELEMDEPAKAYESLMKTLALGEGSSGKSGIAKILVDLGTAAYHLGCHEEAIQHYEYALRLGGEEGGTGDRAGPLALLGRLHEKLGKLDRAWTFYQRALEDHVSRGDRLGQAGSCRNLARLKQAWGEQAEAIRLAQRALALYETIGHLAGRADGLLALGQLQEESGRLQEAMDSYRLAVQVFEEAEDAEGLGKSLMSLARLQEVVGQKPQAAMVYQEALSAWELAAAVQGSALTYSRLAWTSRKIGKSRAALSYYEEALILWREGGESRESARTLMDLGDCFLELGGPERAEAYFREGLSACEDQGDQLGMARALTGLARAQEALGQLTAALKSQELANIFAAQTGESRQGLAESLFKAEILRLLGRIGEARSVAGAVSAFAASAGLPEVFWRAERALGEMALLSGELDGAASHLQQAISAIEEAGDGCREDDLQVGFFNNQQEVYDQLLVLLVEGGQWEEALQISERSRARAFRNLLQTRRGGGEGGSFPAGDGGERAIRGFAADFFKLSEGKTLLVYHALKDRLLAVLLKDGGLLWSGSAAISRSALAERVGNLRAALSRDRAPVRGAAAGGSNLRPELRRLYRLLIEPLEAALGTPPGEILTIIPHGPLFELPFGALLDGEERYLVERYAISYAFCAAQLSFSREAAVEEDAVRAPLFPCLLMGDPIPSEASLARLPGARAEVVGVAQVLKEAAGCSAGEGMVLLGEKASEENFRNLAPASRLIHLAAHARSGTQDGRLPALLLAAAGEGSSQDGLLTAAEIQEMRLGAGLVVLSGCDTGRGELTSDGVMGLARAFLAAGAQSAVASLWKIDDRAAEVFMLAFYRELAKGSPPAQALRAAQLALIALEDPTGPEALDASGPPADSSPYREPDSIPLPLNRQVPPRSLSHPAIWAAFVIYGAAR